MQGLLNGITNLETNMKINATTATWAHLNYQNAMINLQNTNDPFLGKIVTNHVQLCPQNAGFNTLESIVELADQHQDTQFRLHADVKVKGRFTKADLCWYTTEHISNWRCIAEVSNTIKAPCYSLHAGERKGCDLNTLFDKYQQLQELFDCPVAIEGHYPAQNDMWLLSNWEEHEQLLKRDDIFYVIDLSHLNIIGTRHGWDDELVKLLISNKRCLEVHVSFNTGHADSHQPIQKEPDWWKFMQYKNPEAEVFYEGNHSMIYLRENNPAFFNRKPK